ncbi:hypothetical protein [Spongiactinospora sp. 9N601]|uniref:hypothetical protein n=1 Tax=Spongiactinospora sp. 9N601 TaxID=3375149 RepID=UPI003797F9A0
MSFHEMFRDLPPGAGAQAAGLTLGYGGAPARAAFARHGAVRLRCASLLKPLYAWAAHPSFTAGSFSGDTGGAGPDRWRSAAEPAVRVSDNATTLDLWFSAGPRAVLDLLGRRTGVTWVPSPTDPYWFGGVEVTAEEVAAAYGALALAEIGGDPVARTLLTWMRETEQNFGLPGPVAAALGCAADEVAVKCGWANFPDELVLRTHAVAVARSGPRAVLAAALTALPYAHGRETYLERVAAGTPVLDDHETEAGPLLRALITATLTELGFPPVSA